MLFYLFSDFDYTLKPHDNEDCDQVYAKNLDAIKEWKEKGNFFGVATGRSEESLRTQFPNFKEYCDFAVLNNGARIINKGGETIHADQFPARIANELVRLLGSIRYGGKHAIVSFEGATETPAVSSNTICTRLWFENLADCDLTEELILKNIPELGCFTVRGAEFLDDDRLPWVKPGLQHFIEASLDDTNKGSGIKKLARSLSIDHDAIVTIGDDTNDIEMIEEYRGYAISSSSYSVLSRIPKSHVVPNVYDLIAKKLSS